MFKWILCSFLLSCAALAQTPAKIKAINFLQEGEISKLIIDLDKETFAERTHIPQDKQIILDIRNASAEKKKLRGIDTSEFSGSAVFVSPYKKPGEDSTVRFAVQLRDNVRSILENKGNRIILHIENRFGAFSRSKLKKAEGVSVSRVEEESEEKINIPKSASVEDILENLVQSGVKKYVGKRISINVNEINYQELLKMIADVSGFNVIIDEGVSSLPPLTISLTNIPWDQALDTILDLGNLVAFKHSNILTVQTATKAKEEMDKKLESIEANKAQEPLVTKVFPISFANIQDMANIVKDYLTENRGNIQVDERTSNLIIKDTVEVIERIKKVVETLDRQTPQVLIEAKVVEANEDYEFRAGLGRGGLQVGYDPLTPSGSLPTNQGSFSFSSATDSEIPLLSATVSVFKRLNNLNFSLQLMETESKGRIISSPKVITQNNQAATITSTDTRRFLTQLPTDTGVTTQEIQEIPVTIALTVTPKVTNEGSISMAVDLTKGGFGTEGAGGLPNTSQKQITTNVLVDNGSTVVIGGLYQATESETQSGVPFLKDLPLIGWLFKTAYNPSRTRNELIVFLTPRIVNQEEAGLINQEMGDLAEI